MGAKGDKESSHGWLLTGTKTLSVLRTPSIPRTAGAEYLKGG